MNNKKNECKNLGELISWLDERGFDTFEAIEFINDMLSKDVLKRVIKETEKGYAELDDGSI